MILRTKKLSIITLTIIIFRSTTVSKITLNITLNKMTLSITTLSIITLSIIQRSKATLRKITV